METSLGSNDPLERELDSHFGITSRNVAYVSQSVRQLQERLKTSTLTQTTVAAWMNKLRHVTGTDFWLEPCITAVQAR